MISIKSAFFSLISVTLMSDAIFLKKTSKCLYFFFGGVDLSAKSFLQLSHHVSKSCSMPSFNCSAYLSNSLLNFSCGPNMLSNCFLISLSSIEQFLVCFFVLDEVLIVFCGLNILFQRLNVPVNANIQIAFGE